jgi:hypothetical protein
LSSSRRTRDRTNISPILVCRSLGVGLGQEVVLKQLPRTHIFVKEKASWFEVPNREERLVEHEVEFQTKIDTFLSKYKREKKGNITVT